MKPLVFVADTNVVVAGLLTTAPNSSVVIILDAMLSGKLLYLMSPALLHEYRTVLLRPSISKPHGLTEAEVDHLLIEITANAIWREPTETHVAPDRGDDHLWAFLSDYSGSSLITGDHSLHKKPTAENAVISPAAWLMSFGAEA